MPTTPTLRREYPDLIVSYVPLRCDFTRISRVVIGPKTLGFHQLAGDAFRALNTVFMAHNYDVRSKDTGSLACRAITGGSKTSLHAHGIAIDVNWLTNKFVHKTGPIKWGLQTDMSPEMIYDIEAIKTNSGKRLFRWGGRWTNIKDAMHFEIRVLREDLVTGVDWSTVATTSEEDDVMQRGDKGLDVEVLQGMLTDHPESDRWTPITIDGHYGPQTEDSVTSFQRYIGMEKTGVANAITLSVLAGQSQGVGPQGPPGEDGKIPARATGTVVVDFT